MTFFENLQARLTGLDKKTWYRYLAIIGGIFFFIVAVILFFYYRITSNIEEQISEINQKRQEVKQLLQKAQQVKKARAEVTALLEEDPNFKIKAFMQDVFERVGITKDNVSVGNVTQTPTQDSYIEQGASYQIVGISMKQLTELLQAIDESKRVFTKELDIAKSKKIPRTIDVDIKIATMMPREAT